MLRCFLSSVLHCLGRINFFFLAVLHYLGGTQTLLNSTANLLTLLTVLDFNLILITLLTLLYLLFLQLLPELSGAVSGGDTDAVQPHLFSTQPLASPPKARS